MRGEVFKTSYPVCKLKNMSINIFLPQTPLCKYSQTKILHKPIILSSGGGALCQQKEDVISELLTFLLATCYVLQKVEDLPNLNNFFKFDLSPQFYFNEKKYHN